MSEHSCVRHSHKSWLTFLDKHSICTRGLQLTDPPKICRAQQGNENLTDNLVICFDFFIRDLYFVLDNIRVGMADASLILIFDFLHTDQHNVA